MEFALRKAVNRMIPHLRTALGDLSATRAGVDQLNLRLTTLEDAVSESNTYVIRALQDLQIEREEE